MLDRSTLNILLIIICGSLAAMGFGIRAGIRYYRKTHILWRSIVQGIMIGFLWVIATAYLVTAYGFSSG